MWLACTGIAIWRVAKCNILPPKPNANRAMEKRIAKQDIIKACALKQEVLITNFSEREAELKADAYNRSESASQSEDRTIGKVELLKAMGDELVFVQNELAYLLTLDADKLCHTVEPGAVVMTDKLNFFIGISSEKIEVGGTPFFGISAKAPIYANMVGLAKGDSFQFGEARYNILDLY